MDEDKQDLPQGDSLDARVDRVATQLDEEDAAAAAKTTVSGDDEGGPEASEVAPPVSWSKEEKAAFARLPPEAQAAIARREGERERLLTTRTQELSRRERETEAERLRLVQALDAVIGEAEADPVLREGGRIDWARLQREDPAAYAQRFPAYQQRLAAIEAARRNRDTLAAETLRGIAARESQLLAAKLPEYAEPSRRQALMDEIDAFLQEDGFTREEIGRIHDHRAILIARDAMRWRQQEKARKSLAAKKVAPASRVQPPGTAAEGRSASDRLARLRKRAAATGKLDDRAAYVLAALDENE